MTATPPSAVAPAREILPPPTDGRVVVRERRVRLGDVDIDASLRLDATARYLQDVATDDAADAALGDAFGWVVRRTMIVVEQPAKLGERLELATFCSGTGRTWAERRTSIAGARGARIDTVALWIRVDPQSGRPQQLDDAFMAVYGPAAGGRRVSTRLSLQKHAPDATTSPWVLRRADVDPFGHVNNAAQFAALEELLDGRAGTAEIEYVRPLIGPGEEARTVDLVIDHQPERTDAWLRHDGTTHTALRWTPGSTGTLSP